MAGFLTASILDIIHPIIQNPSEARAVSELIALIEKGASPTYCCFWGHTPKDPNQVDQSCLSNWFPAPFHIDDVLYPTTEHYMMAAKAREFDDLAIQDQIIEAAGPREAKTLGRQVSGFTDEIWNARRFEIVVEGNLAKFSQNAALGDFLLSTGDAVLVEASPRDRIWGIGIAPFPLTGSFPTHFDVDFSANY